jgi:hypothetical protein
MHGLQIVQVGVHDVQVVTELVSWLDLTTQKGRGGTEKVGNPNICETGAKLSSQDMLRHLSGVKWEQELGDGVGFQ